MDMQSKFTEALEKLAEERGLDLVVERNFANAGSYSFQPRTGFEPVLRFPFRFETGHSVFTAGASSKSKPLGQDPNGGRWAYVEGGEHDLLLARVAEILNEHPDVGPAHSAEENGEPLR